MIFFTVRVVSMRFLFAFVRSKRNGDRLRNSCVWLTSDRLQNGFGKRWHRFAEEHFKLTGVTVIATNAPLRLRAGPQPRKAQQDPDHQPR
jgi:hypothetical protein